MFNDFINYFIKNGYLEIIIYSVIGIILFKVIKRIFEKSNKISKKKKQQTIKNIILNIIKYVIVLFLLLKLLSLLGVNITSIMAGLGIIGIIIGLALQDVMNDVFVGISIVLEDQFDIGDYVSINGFEGNVQEITLKNTKIRNYKGEIKILSNRVITELTNYSKENQILPVDIPMSYDVKNELALKVVNSIIKRASKEVKTLKGNIELLGINEFKDSNIDYRIMVPVKIDTQFAVKRQINMIIKEEFDKANISVPFNIVEVRNG